MIVLIRKVSDGNEINHAFHVNVCCKLGIDGGVA